MNVSQLVLHRCRSAGARRRSSMPWTVALAVALGVASASADERIRYRTYGAEDGLSGEPVYSVLQDHQGYLWVATAGGLDRFDGHRFESFRPDDERPGSLPKGRVLAMVEDPAGRLWVGTETGPARYDREQKSFRLLPLPSASAAEPDSGVDPPSVHALFVDRRETLWMGTDQGVYRLDSIATEPRAGEIRAGFDGLSTTAPELADSRVYAFAEDGEGRLWIGTRSGLLRLSFRDGRTQLDHFVHDLDDLDSLHDDEIYALLVDRRGDLWIGTWGTGGLGRLEADQLAADEPRFRRFVYPPGDPRGIPLGVVKSLLEDRDDHLWVGTQEAGLCLLTADERRRAEPHFRCMPHAPLDPTSSPRSPFLDVVQDDQGILWFAAQGGLARHVPATAKVTLVHPQPEPGGSARSIGVNAIRETRTGTVWVATSEGLERLVEPDRDGDPLRIERFLHDPDDPASLSSNWVNALLEDRQQRLWVGTVRGGLHRLVADEPIPRFERYRAESGITNSTVFSLHEDPQGVLWVGTYLGLFHATVPSSADRPTFQRLDPNLGALSSELVYTTFDDLRGRLWLGTDRGLDRLSATRDRLETDLLAPGLVVLQGLTAADGTLWLLTDSEGLISVDPDTDTWQARGADFGLPGAALSGSFDALGRLWVTTTRRLHRIDPTTDEVRTFGRGDGLRILPFREQSFHRGSSGRFFVGGANGLAVFYPEELSHAPLVAPVVLRDLQLANRSVAVGPDGPLPRSIETLDRLVLQPDDDMMSVEFAALVFHRQEAVRYAHRLRGFSDQWVESDMTQRRATFTNLSPGDYTLEVRARGDVGSWGPQNASLAVRVLPEWFETTWARVLALVFGLGLPLWWLVWRFRRLEAHRRELQALVDRWQIERRQRLRWQDRSVTAAQLARQIRGPLERVLHRARTRRDETATDAERDLVDEILDPVQEATTKLDELAACVVVEHAEDETVDETPLVESAQRRRDATPSERSRSG
ncbi:MAG: two-component regulator propeller domain-containing protein [Acidobacteriota bacterium]